MSFINWGNEPPEQLKARKRMEDTMMFERASFAAAAAAAGAAGSGGFPGPKYCGGDKTIIEYEFVGIDFIDDLAAQPTAAELSGYAIDQPDKDTAYRGARDARHKAQAENILAEWEGRLDDIEPLPDYAQTTVFHRGIIREDQTTWWKPLTEYEEWTTPDSETGLIPAELMPGISEVTVRTAVDLKADLPTTGNTGEIIKVVDDLDENLNGWYAWDENLSQFNKIFYDKYMVAASYQQANRDASVKAKNELLLAMAPFIWASYYVPDYRIVKDNL